MDTFSTTQVKKSVGMILRDFTQERDLVSTIFSNFHRYSCNEGDYDEKRLIRYIFSEFLNFEVWDKPFEKVNWEIVFKYKGVCASFLHEKFGFRIYIDNELAQRDAEKYVEEIKHKIDQCFKLIKPVVREEGIKSLKMGEIIIDNRLSELEKRFVYFLRESRRKKKLSHFPGSLKLNKKFNFELYKQSKYLTDATYMAFFSLIEHICILGLAFTNSPDKLQIELFSRKIWRDKFKQVFSLDDDEFAEIYKKLSNLSKYCRNPSEHGHLDKLYTIFHFYLPGAAHRIPMGLYDRELLYGLRQEDNLAVLESFMKLIRKNKNTKKWMWYLDRGFPVDYERQSLSEYQAYMKLKEREAKNYLDYWSRMEDNYSNMDW